MGGSRSWLRVAVILAISLSFAAPSRVVAQPAPDPELQGLMQDVYKEFLEQAGADLLKEAAKQAGYQTVGQFIAAIPQGETAEAVGRALEGDVQGVTEALTKGMAKAVAAKGATTLVFGAGAAGAAPLAVAVGAAVLAGKVVDGVRGYRMRALRQRIGELEARYAAVAERDRYQVEDLRSTIEFYRWVLDFYAWSADSHKTFAALDHRAYLGGRMSGQEYLQRIEEINAKIADDVSKFNEVYGELRDKVHQRKDALAQELAKVREQYDELAARRHLMGLGGAVHVDDPEVAAEMRALYRRWQYLNESLQQLQGLFPDPEVSVVFLVDCSGSMQGAKLQEAIAAVREAVAATNNGKTEWALLTFGGCTVTTVCGFTMNAGKLQAAAGRLAAAGDTPLSYATAKATTYLTTRGRGERGRLILLADGEDNCRERGALGPDEAGAAVRPLYEQRRAVPMPRR